MASTVPEVFQLDDSRPTEQERRVVRRARQVEARAFFLDLCRREPLLDQLRREIAAVARRPVPDAWCANREWYGHRGRGAGYRARLVETVGWYARSTDPVVRSSRAYEVATEALWSALPNCRRCLCAVWENGELVQ